MDENIKKAAEIAEKEFPGYDVEIVVPYKGKYYVSVIPPNDEIGFANFHEIDIDTGEVSGYISIMELCSDPEFNKTLSKTRPFKKRGLFRALRNKRTKMGR